jgi:hypothetical protein
MILESFIRKSRPAGRPPRFRPQLEALEERLVMNNRFVVPLAQADNVTKFATLQAALTNPGLAAGDVIQIEPGSSPGSIGGGDLRSVQNLTIRGDASVRAADLPAFDVTSTLIVGSNQAGLALRNVHFTLSTGGIDINSVHATIADCSVQSSFSDDTAIFLVNTTDDVITGNQMLAEPAANEHPLLEVQVVDGSHNLISGNTLQSLPPVPQSLLAYVGPANSTPQIADRVVHNTFIGNGNSRDPLVQVFFGNMHGLDVEANTFIEQGGLASALQFTSGDVQASIVNNDFHLSGVNSFCLEIGQGAANTASQFLIAGNRFEGLGGLLLSMNGTGAIKARVEGNDFHNTQIGVKVETDGGGDTSGIDLGGGNQGSLGGNDFRGFTSAPSSNNAAILAAADPTLAPVQAQRNLFSVADPHSVILDHQNFNALNAVVTDNNLTGNAAFVQSLYVQFLHRAGDTTNPQDAGGWINFLNHGGSLNTVADGVIRSKEGLGLQVEDLYQRLLGRDADANEQAAWAVQIQHGQTLESVTEQILESPEYQTRFANNADFVQSLYGGLLHRDGSAAELAGWLAALPALGRAGVAHDFVTSLEFRSDVIGEDYTQLLHRTPMAAEVNGWLATGLDALSIDRFFATSAEFQVNG